jgi:hypothetical protein
VVKATNNNQVPLVVNGMPITDIQGTRGSSLPCLRVQPCMSEQPCVQRKGVTACLAAWVLLLLLHAAHDSVLLLLLLCRPFVGALRADPCRWYHVLVAL